MLTIDDFIAKFSIWDAILLAAIVAIIVMARERIGIFRRRPDGPKKNKGAH